MERTDAEIAYEKIPKYYFGLIGLLQIGVFFLCNYIFEFYIGVILLSIAGVIFIKKKGGTHSHSRILELTFIETWFVCLLYGIYFIGANWISTLLLLVLFFLVQGGLFLYAGIKMKNYRKFTISLIHSVIIAYLILSNWGADSAFGAFPAMIPAEFNDFYSLIYLVWVIPFITLFTGDGFAPWEFILLHILSLTLSFLHEDFLSMRLFTAQITFLSFGLLRIPHAPRMTKNFSTISKIVEFASLIALLALIGWGYVKFFR